jgi:Meiosis protein SPO22/ZIP4 like
VLPFTTRSATYLSYSFQLIWQYGDRHYHVKKWKEAADWFRAGSHQVFKNMGSSNVSKCLRKAALCHVQQREYAKAASDIRLCANSEATTHYMTLLIAVRQGQVISITSDVI